MVISCAAPQASTVTIAYAIHSNQSGASTHLSSNRTGCTASKMWCSVTEHDGLVNSANSSCVIDNAVTTEGANLLVAYLEDYAQS
jgi:hypothetical protein